MTTNWAIFFSGMFLGAVVTFIGMAIAGSWRN